MAMNDILTGPSSSGFDDPPQRAGRMDGIDHLPVIEFRSSTLAWLLKSGAGWMLLLFCIAVIGAGAWFGYGLIATAVIFGAFIPYVIYRHLKNSTHIYWLDGDRLFMRRGILVRSEEEIELYRIKDVKVTFSIIQQMFENGDLIISSSDKTSLDSHGRSEIIIANVVDARAIRGEIRDRVEAVRVRRGVRELDIG